MAKKRTKLAKKRATTHRKLSPAAPLSQSATTRGSVPSQSVVQMPASAPSETASNEAELLLGYPTRLLYKDLLRSLAITLFLVVVLVGIVLYLQFGA